MFKFTSVAFTFVFLLATAAGCSSGGNPDSGVGVPACNPACGANATCNADGTCS